MSSVFWGPDRHSISSFEIVLYARQHVERVSGVAADPAIINFLDWYRVQIIPPAPPGALDDDQVGILENAQVLHDGTAIELSEVRANLPR